MADNNIITLLDIRKDQEPANRDPNDNDESGMTEGRVEPLGDQGIFQGEPAAIHEHLNNRRNRPQMRRNRAFRPPTSGNGIFQVNMVLQLMEVNPILRTLEGQINERRRLPNRVGGVNVGTWRRFTFGGTSSGVNLHPRGVVGIGKAFNPEEAGLLDDNGLFHPMLRCGICGENQAIGEAMIHFLHHGRDHQILIGHTGEMYRKEHCQLSMKFEETEQRMNYVLDYRFLMSGYYRYNWDMACLYDTMMAHSTKVWMDTLRNWFLESHIKHYRHAVASGVM